MGFFSKLFKKSKTPAPEQPRGGSAKAPAAREDRAVIYRVLTMNGVNALVPQQTYAALEDGFLRHAQGVLGKDGEYRRMNAAFSSAGAPIAHTIAEIQGVNIMEDPIRWLCGRTGQSREALIGQLGKRLFMSKGGANYETFGQTRKADYSVAFYFHGEVAVAPVKEAGDTAAPSAAGGYTVEQGVRELCEAFSLSAGESSERVRAIGQALYDAKIPLQSGVGGMHQAYHQFKTKMPARTAELSRIWDGVGDWAD